MSYLERLPNTYRTFFGPFASLSPAQKALIEPILNGQDVVLQAGTGLGKTEAVLAPATERLMTASSPFTVIYVVPTRALALDMNRRIHSLYKQLGLKAGLRTGDSKTQRDGAPHLLILTPESLDVLLGSRNRDNRHFLKHVRILIIDEVHMFLHDMRGCQLSHLRRRLKLQSTGALQTLTLSATISDPKEITLYFGLENAFCYRQAATRELTPCWVHLEDEKRELVPFFDDLLLRWGCKKLLVFANSRRKCEQLFELLNREGLFSDHVLLHYSNLSTKERRSIESSFRNDRKSVCIATSTLEMGIDIGDIDGVVLMGPPPSTMAFLQRIGRGNRRRQEVKFWGVCQGGEAEIQLVRFLALFELAKENRMEKLPIVEYDSVLFQQVLSCLYAKRIVSQKMLEVLFKKEHLSGILKAMVAKHWLKPTPHEHVFCGGWRYVNALKNQMIWSNFPPKDEEYDVILGNEKIAVLPLSIVRQLEIGTLFRLVGKTLKVCGIEEKKSYHELLVEESDQSVDKELSWMGMGAQTPFEIAQTAQSILLSNEPLQGLLKRTNRLLEKARARIHAATVSSSGVYIYRLENGLYRYETFLGSIGNFIINHLIKSQFCSKIEGLFIRSDEWGIESNEWIPWESIKFPRSAEQLQHWISSHLPLLKQLFSWNSWLYWLPEDIQEKEISSGFLDLRLLEFFERYRKETKPLTPPNYLENRVEEGLNSIPMQGQPHTIQMERDAWGGSVPSQVKSDLQSVELLTASQVQSYLTQGLCPKFARFQYLRLTVDPHPRFHDRELEKHSRQQEGALFKEQVIGRLQKNQNARRESSDFSLKKAIEEVILTEKSLFLIQAKLQIDQEVVLKGSPDLIYLKHEGTHIQAEVWDIRSGYTVTYAQKWRVAFYAHLLELALEGEFYSLPIKVSSLGGVIHRQYDEEKLFERSHFQLLYFRDWIPRLIAGWRSDSKQEAAHRPMEVACTSCCYFSHCYQDMLFEHSASSKELAIIPLSTESNEFPKNAKQWFFLRCDRDYLRWQCWEGQEVVAEAHIRLEEYPDWKHFQDAVVMRLLKDWNRAIRQDKTPHFLVYESFEWHLFKNMFESTDLRSLWASHSCRTAMQPLFEKHFIWPVDGRLTAMQVGRCLGLISDSPPPLSLFHEDCPPDDSFDVFRLSWSWFLSKVKSRRLLFLPSKHAHSVPLIDSYLAIEHREQECKAHAILEFQKNPLAERVANFRAIAPLTFLGAASNGPHLSYAFSIDAENLVSKFRVGDFLKLSPIESTRIQEGFSVVLESYSATDKSLSIRSLSRKMPLSKRQLYVLDESAEDWNGKKIEEVLNRLKDPQLRPELIQMLYGIGRNFASNRVEWLEKWYPTYADQAGLNESQKQALSLPFSKSIGLIEGPPGTGKTHLLVWTLAALIAHARASNCPIKILVTAQTHHAIDLILKRTAKILETMETGDVSLWKYGRYDKVQFLPLNIQELHTSKELSETENLILGATGFGVYQLLGGKNFPQLFDWIVFDESSQVLPSYALLSLIFGKGHALFYGDTQQLPPVLMGEYKDISFTPRSILEELISRCSSHNRVRLNETYRMNEAICQFASRQWYDNQLKSVVAPDKQTLHFPRYPLFHDHLDEELNPSRPIVVVQLKHEGCCQSSQEEALWIACATKRLIESYAVPSDEIGIISPHRLQNNVITHALKEILPAATQLPKIDTVERMQGREFDVVIFSATVSDKKTIHSQFLKDYRRFNVALTRSRKKFIFVASEAFFHSFPMNERELKDHSVFEALLS